MLLGHIDLEENPNAWVLQPRAHNYTWEYYFNQYAIVLKYIIQLSVQKNYQLNFMQMPVMFIFRHTVELYMKMKLAQQGNKVSPSHDLSSLGKFDFLSSCSEMNVLKPENNGDNFKYLLDRDGKRFYDYEILDVLPAIVCFVSKNDENINNIFSSFELDINDKKLRNEWKFYTIDTRSLGIIKTQYDALILSLLKVINANKIAISDVYLPLLFMIRHSLELGLKDNLLEVKRDLTLKQQSKLNEHKLVALYNIISEIVDSAKKRMSDGNVLIEQINKYEPLTKNICSSFGNLDAKSYNFRFPVDENGNAMSVPFSNLDIKNVLKIFQEIDPYVSLSLLLLKEYGFIDAYDEDYC